MVPLQTLSASAGAVPVLCDVNRARAAAALLGADEGNNIGLVPAGIDLTREAVVHELALLYDLMAVLRAECPWDRAQTQASIVRYTLEETYELVDAVNQYQEAEGGSESTADTDVMGELGDLLFQVYFLAVVAQEEQRYDLGEVAAGIRDKLVRRHPHVFADIDAPTADDVRRNWDQIKRHTEGREGIFHEVPEALSSPLLAQKLQSRAAEVGFDWPDARGPLLKVDEELQELRLELEQSPESPAPGMGDERVAAELGDLLFAVVNVARKLKVDPELALRTASKKFRVRVEVAAELAEAEGHVWSSLDLNRQEEYYQRAKADLASCGETKRI
ncbi:MAG: nucleoside triphosphate pyrophosphohydrolase [Actinobacteria bacterium]|nr:nucleoside triphosphate pyrophosphohydrolase [Actinomycetota bacterium]